MPAAAAASGGSAGERIVVALDGNGVEGGSETVARGVGAVLGEGIGVRVFGPAAQLGSLDGTPGVELIDSPETITNTDEPVAAVRSRPQASVVRAAADVAAGHSAALASAGSTGAAMTAALFALRRLRGVQRPALAVQLPVPGRTRPVLMLDVGASVEARAQHLIQFAFLGSAFARAVLGVDEPRVALLSVGEEPSKGTPQVVEAHQALGSAEGIVFTGNIEGRDLLGDAADVVVTDGFTGNVALKTLEGTAKAVSNAVRTAARSGPVAAAGGLMLRPALAGLRRQLDPDQTGGAILLGLRGPAVIAHGSSGPEGIANAIRLAAETVRTDAINRTRTLLERSGATRGGMRRDTQSGMSGVLSPTKIGDLDE